MQNDYSQGKHWRFIRRSNDESSSEDENIRKIPKLKY